MPQKTHKEKCRVAACTCQKLDRSQRVNYSPECQTVEELPSGCELQIWARGEIRESPVPAWRESSRTSVDSLLGDTFLQFENNSSSRSPLVTVMPFVTVVQSADLR